MNSKMKIVWICAVLVCLTGALWIAAPVHRSDSMLSYSRFFEKLRAGQIASVTIMSGHSGAAPAVCTLNDGTVVQTVLPRDYRDALTAMQEKQVDVEISNGSVSTPASLKQGVPFLLLVAVWLFFLLRSKLPTGLKQSLLG